MSANFIRLHICTEDYGGIERLSRKHGGWPTNSKYECRNGLFSTVGYHFDDGIPDAFVSRVIEIGASVVQAPGEDTKERRYQRALNHLRTARSQFTDADDEIIRDHVETAIFILEGRDDQREAS